MVAPDDRVEAAAEKGHARTRRSVAAKYLEVADLLASEGGAAIDLCVGLAALAGLAAGDAVCLAATGERYSGTDHAAAAELLGRVDARLGSRLAGLVALEPGSHNGHALPGAKDRDEALRSACALVDGATVRTT